MGPGRIAQHVREEAVRREPVGAEAVPLGVLRDVSQRPFDAVGNGLAGRRIVEEPVARALEDREVARLRRDRDGELDAGGARSDLGDALALERDRRIPAGRVHHDAPEAIDPRKLRIRGPVHDAVGVEDGIGLDDADRLALLLDLDAPALLPPRPTRSRGPGSRIRSVCGVRTRRRRAGSRPACRPRAGGTDSNRGSGRRRTSRNGSACRRRRRGRRSPTRCRRRSRSSRRSCSRSPPRRASRRRRSPRVRRRSRRRGSRRAAARGRAVRGAASPARRPSDRGAAG